MVIANAKATTLLPILKERIVPDSIVYSDSLPSYNALDVSGFRHLRINHSQLFAAGKNHINGIENFWNQAVKRRSAVKKSAVFWPNCNHTAERIYDLNAAAVPSSAVPLSLQPF